MAKYRHHPDTLVALIAWLEYCPDAQKPYVNSLELEKFIESL